MSSTPTVEPTKLKEVCREFAKNVINQQNADACDRYLDRNIRDNTLPPGTAQGLDGAKQFYRELFRAFPDCRLKIDDIIAEGEKVAYCWTFTGTHQGEFLGIQPTNKRVEVHGCEIDHFQNGKIVNVEGTVDMLGMVQQMGVGQLPGLLGQAG